MTRINLVDPKELHTKHLVAEYREIVRPFALVRRRQSQGMKPSGIKIPSEYTLGTGHVTFFYNKLQYLLNRYEALVGEMLRRGYRPNRIPVNELMADISPEWFGDYVPTTKAVELNKQRIKERMPK